VLNVQGLSLEKFNNHLVPRLLPNKYDFICFCETWLKSNDIKDYELPDYYCVNRPRMHMHKRAKRGSGGVLLYIHKSVKGHVELQENGDSEDRLWIKIHHPYSHVNVFCCFCYTPPANSIITCNEVSQWSTLESEIIQFSSKGQIIICGDLNARTGNQNDFISVDSEIPIDLPCGYVPDSNTSPRVSQDIQVNTQGKYLLDLCISCRLRIVNGRHKGRN